MRLIKWWLLLTGLFATAALGGTWLGMQLALNMLG